MVSVYLLPRENGVWFEKCVVTPTSAMRSGSLVNHHPIFTRILSDQPCVVGNATLNENFPHGPVQTYDPGGGTVLPLVHFPENATSLYPEYSDQPKAAAIWIGPPRTFGPNRRNEDKVPSTEQSAENDEAATHAPDQRP